MSDASFVLPVVSCRPVGARQALLTVDGRGSPLLQSYTVPGQYSRLATPDSDGLARPMAIASPPGEPDVQFLLKVPEDRLAALCATGADDRVTATPAQGPGFPLERALDKVANRSLWLFAGGSGVAPLRAVIDALLPQRSSVGDVVLFYGVRVREDLAFTDRFATWVGHGISVRPVLSRPGSGWDGLVGYVQDHLPKQIPHPAKAVAFVCGLPEMDKAVHAALLERGVGPDQVFRNY